MVLTLALITAVSLLFATAMAAFAWRSARGERRRAQARVAALTAAIHRHDWPLREPGVELFSASRADQRSSRAPLVIALGALGALGVFLAGTRVAPVAFGPLPSRATTPRVPATPTTLELMALTHEREADRLTVRGVVRNPAAAPVTRLTAVVSLCNYTGGIIASGRAPVERMTVEPGTDSPFVVTIPVAAEVASYRVSFMTGTGVVPHVDRRSRAVVQAKQP